MAAYIYFGYTLLSSFSFPEGASLRTLGTVAETSMCHMKRVKASGERKKPWNHGSSFVRSKSSFPRIFMQAWGCWGQEAGVPPSWGGPRVFWPRSLHWGTGEPTTPHVYQFGCEFMVILLPLASVRKLPPRSPFRGFIILSVSLGQLAPCRVQHLEAKRWPG